MFEWFRDICDPILSVFAGRNYQVMEEYFYIILTKLKKRRYFWWTGLPPSLSVIHKMILTVLFEKIRR